jgi:hypothetical protein
MIEGEIIDERRPKLAHNATTIVAEIDREARRTPSPTGTPLIRGVTHAALRFGQALERAE